MENVSVFGIEVSAWVVAPIVYFVWVSVLLLVKRIVFAGIKRFAAKTKTQLDDVFVSALNFPLTLLIFVSGAVVVERILPVAPEAELTKYFFVGFRVTAIAAIILFFDKLLRGLIDTYADRVDVLRASRNVAQGIVRIVVIGLGLLILLDTFGVSITPLLASLGIGSLAVALALQPTLENFFSGVQIMIDRPIRVGQFIKLDSGEQGYVHKIGWRSTWIRMLPNNVVVMPNKVLLNSRVVNYYYPQQDLAVLVQAGVHYDSNLKDVERITVEVAQDVMKTVTGGVPEFTPFIRYHTFNDFSIDFTVIMRAKEFVDNYLIKHEFIKRLHERYAKEDIVIPYPIRAINNAQEKTA